MVAMATDLAEERLRLFVPALYAAAVCFPDAVDSVIEGSAARSERVGELAAGSGCLCVAAARAVHAPLPRERSARNGQPQRAQSRKAPASASLATSR